MMPGMGGGLSITDPFIYSLFRHSLFGQFLWILGLSAALVMLAGVVRGRGNMVTEVDPPVRSYVAWIFGGLWLVDGILQFQRSMPLGLSSEVVTPANEGSPSWLHSLVGVFVDMWNRHPLDMASATAWIQVGIGLLLLVARGRVRRFGALVSVAWGLVIWSIGNSCGGIFSPTASILFGWPGAIFFYLLAGLWLLVPGATFRKHFSRVTSRVLAALCLGGAIIQCMPSHGFWRPGVSNSLTQMGVGMAHSAQPSWLAALIIHVSNWFGEQPALWNVVIVEWLLLCALGLWRRGGGNKVWPYRLLIGGAVAGWVLVQDLGIFGGLSTDMNSLLPLAVLAWCAAPGRQRSAAIQLPLASNIRRVVGTLLGAVGLSAVAVASCCMGLALFSTAAEPVLFYAQNGEMTVTNNLAPPFQLTDVNGSSYTMGSHRDRWTVVTFLDPQCCVASERVFSELATLEKSLGAHSRLDVVAVDANPFAQESRSVRNFLQRTHTTQVGRMHVVTGSVSNLSYILPSYGYLINTNPHARTSIAEISLFFVDPTGVVRVIISDNPLGGPAYAASAQTVLVHALEVAGYH
jgi:cytochrome oxidase Cu insertion factor (SCO1/SenC/PrrC family)